MQRLAQVLTAHAVYENLPSSFPEELHPFRFLPETHGRPRIPGVLALPLLVPRCGGNELLAPVSLLVLLPAPAASLSPPGPHSPAELGLPWSRRSADQATLPRGRDIRAAKSHASHTTEAFAADIPALSIPLAKPTGPVGEVPGWAPGSPEHTVTSTRDVSPNPGWKAGAGRPGGSGCRATPSL